MKNWDEVCIFYLIQEKAITYHATQYVSAFGGTDWYNVSSSINTSSDCGIPAIRVFPTLFTENLTMKEFLSKI